MSWFPKKIALVKSVVPNWGRISLKEEIFCSRLWKNAFLQ